MLAATDEDVALYLVETEASATLDHRPALGLAEAPGVGPIAVTARVEADLARPELDALLASARRRSPVAAAIERSVRFTATIEGLP